MSYSFPGFPQIKETATKANEFFINHKEGTYLTKGQSAMCVTLNDQYEFQEIYLALQVANVFVMRHNFLQRHTEINPYNDNLGFGYLAPLNGITKRQCSRIFSPDPDNVLHYYNYGVNRLGEKTIKELEETSTTTMVLRSNGKRKQPDTLQNAKNDPNNNNNNDKSPQKKRRKSSAVTPEEKENIPKYRPKANADAWNDFASMRQQNMTVRTYAKVS
jgi:hypothetical protein